MSTSYNARQEATRWTAEHTSPAGTTNAGDDAQTKPATQSESATPTARATNAKPTDPAELLLVPLRTVAQTAALLNVPEGWLYRKASRRQIPFTKVGHYLRFSAEDIQAIVRDGARPVRETARDARSRPPSRRR
jgi:excisionase family DNA binding protein